MENCPGEAVYCKLDEQAVVLITCKVFSTDTRFKFEIDFLETNTFLLFLLFLPPLDLKVELGHNWPANYRYVTTESIFVLKNASNLACIVKKNQPLNAIAFHCKYTWLLKYHPSEFKVIMSLIDTETIVVRMSSGIKNLATKILEIKERQDLERLSLICLDTFGKIIYELAEKQQKIEHNSGIYTEGINAVEQKINSELYHKLPPIKELSKLALMSESSLKRHFRWVFGKPIYEYYLEIKMMHAKDMLSQNKTSISEIARTLGYQKASSFTKIFKKHFGCLPSDIIKDLT